VIASIWVLLPVEFDCYAVENQGVDNFRNACTVHICCGLWGLPSEKRPANGRSLDGAVVAEMVYSVFIFLRGKPDFPALILHNVVCLILANVKRLV